MVADATTCATWSRRRAAWDLDPLDAPTEGDHVPGEAVDEGGRCGGGPATTSPSWVRPPALDLDDAEVATLGRLIDRVERAAVVAAP